MAEGLDPGRVAVLKKIEEFERAGIFDKDVEEDPPAPVLMPGVCDYKQKKLITRIKAKIVFSMARKYLKSLVKSGALRIKEVRGIEHLDSLKKGAILTCNHFSALDTFLMQSAYERSSCKKKRKLFRVIREGNYTNFPGFYGKLMRNCNTLPLSSNVTALKECFDGVHYHLKKGHLVLVYAEQSMWWNYRKPKPLKSGAFHFAVKANVPVVPFFIGQEDTSDIGEDGFPIQEYTIIIGEPIYPDDDFDAPRRAEVMLKENEAWSKKAYEDFYGIKLTYLCGQPNEG